MKIRKMDGSEEKRILTCMIVDDVVCSRIVSQWNGDLFRNDWANTVAGWCVEFFNDFGVSPKSSIEGVFESWANNGFDAGSVSLIDKFLSSLSGEFESLSDGINSEYIIDLSQKYFNRIRLEKLAEGIQNSLESNRLGEATAKVVGWDQVSVNGSSGVDLLLDSESIQRAFEQKSDPIITYPGALGRFFGSDLERDSFIGFMGATGRGKTWWLLDVAWRAITQRRKVAFFEVGDMSESQIIRRFMVRAARAPLIAKTVLLPTRIDVTNNEVELETQEKIFPENLDWETAWNSLKKKRKVFSGKSLKLSVHANSSINVSGIRGILDVWAREGWVPDVIVIDYADILSPLPGVPDGRDQINATWKGLRGLSQSLHCCVITATQSDAASYLANTISRSNFSDDRRKLDHVTGMIGINSTEEEKARGISRLNWVKRREEEYNENRCVFVAGSLAIGSPAMKSAIDY